MPLVSAKCTQCGAPLKVDPTKETAVCPFCKTEYYTEKAINNYNYNYNIGSGNTIIIPSDDSIERQVKAGETFLNMGDYSSAEATFTTLTRKFPDDYRGWWGLIKVYSRNFTNTNISRTTLRRIETTYNNMCKAAGAKVGSDLKARYKSYSSTVRSKLDRLQDEYKVKIGDLQNRISELNNERNRLQKTEIRVFKLAKIIAIVLAILLLYAIASPTDSANFAYKSAIANSFSYLVFFGGIAFIVCKVRHIGLFGYPQKIAQLESQESTLRAELDGVERWYKDNLQ